MKAVIDFIIEHHEAIITLIGAIFTRAIEKPKVEKKAVKNATKQE